MRLPKRKDYPRRIYYKQSTYEIEFVEGLVDFGETDPSDMQIRIREGLSDREAFKTFIHELLHVIELEDDLKIPHKIIYQFELGLYRLFKKNF